MYIYTYIDIYIHIQVNIYIYHYMHTWMYVHVHIYILKYGNINVHMYKIIIRNQNSALHNKQTNESGGLLWAGREVKWGLSGFTTTNKQTNKQTFLGYPLSVFNKKLYSQINKQNPTQSKNMTMTIRLVQWLARMKLTHLPGTPQPTPATPSTSAPTVTTYPTSPQAPTPPPLPPHSSDLPAPPECEETRLNGHAKKRKWSKFRTSQKQGDNEKPPKKSKKHPPPDTSHLSTATPSTYEVSHNKNGEQF